MTYKAAQKNKHWSIKHYTENQRSSNTYPTKNKQWSTKHYTENQRSNNTYPTKNKQWSTKHYTENQRSSNTNPTNYLCIGGRDGIPLTGLALPHLCACPKPEFQHHMSWSFLYAQWFDMRGDCSLCWYWRRARVAQWVR